MLYGIRRGAAVLLAAGLFASALLPYTACAGDAAPEDADGTEGTRAPYHFVMACKNNSEGLSKTLAEQIQLRIEARGDEIVLLDGEGDSELQCSLLEAALPEKPDGVFLHPAGAKGVLSAVDHIRDEGIPIVGLNMELTDMSGITSFTGTDNYQAGEVIGAALRERYPEGGTVLNLVVTGNDTITVRMEGIRDSLAGSGLTILENLDCPFTREGTEEKVLEALERYPELSVIIGSDDVLGLGALDAIGEMGNETVKVFSIGGTPAMKREIANGTPGIVGTVALSPFAMAETAVTIMYACMDGQSVKARYSIEGFLITAENVANYGTDTWQ